MLTPIFQADHVALHKALKDFLILNAPRFATKPGYGREAIAKLAGSGLSEFSQAERFRVLDAFYSTYNGGQYWLKFRLEFSTAVKYGLYF